MSKYRIREYIQFDVKLFMPEEKWLGVWWNMSNVPFFSKEMALAKVEERVTGRKPHSSNVTIHEVDTSSFK